jgi:hypothetical protein
MKTHYIRSFDEYCQYAEHLKGVCYFRGQSDSDWDIKPSLFRNENLTSLADERATIDNVLINDTTKTPLEALIYAQNHEGNTRFCDVTVSYLCALFFATYSKNDKHDNDDGAVFVIDKSNAVSAKSKEVELFSYLLTHDVKTISDFPTTLSSDNLQEELTSNHLVEAFPILYSNDRSFRQGGTGIIFGFDITEDGLLLPKGKSTVDDLVLEKLVIAKVSKAEILSRLRSLGYTVETLFCLLGDDGKDEAVSISVKDLKLDKYYGNGYTTNKVIAKCKVNTIHYLQGNLTQEIARLYDSMFKEYGETARVFTSVYYDESDVSNANWICQGIHDDTHRFVLNWNQDYISIRLSSMNSQISSNEAVSRFQSLVEKMIPHYYSIRGFYEDKTFDVEGMKNYACANSEEVQSIFLESGDIARSDAETERLSESAESFLRDACALFNGLLITNDSADSVLRNVKLFYLPECEKSLADYRDEVQKRNTNANTDS